MASERLGILHVRVVATGDQFKWMIRNECGKILECASEPYPTDIAALRAGNAAARAIRKLLAEADRSTNQPLKN
jgi:hypothetical protein